MIHRRFFAAVLCWTIISAITHAEHEEGKNETTTTEPPITTVKPIPLIPTFAVYNGSKVCLLMETNLKVVIPFFTKKGEPSFSTFYINSTSKRDVISDGNCDDSSALLLLKWFPGSFQRYWVLQLFYVRVDEASDQHHFKLARVTFDYSLSNKLFPETNDTSSYLVGNNDTQFTCPVGAYFACMAQQTFGLTPNMQQGAATSNPKVFLSTSYMKVQAFGNTTEPIFVGTRHNCSADYIPSKVVPIIVGVALAAMIVVALVAFFIGRRPRNNEYQPI